MFMTLYILYILRLVITLFQLSFVPLCKVKITLLGIVWGTFFSTLHKKYIHMNL